MKSQFHQAFKTVSELADQGVRLLLIGGFAVNHYGYTRNTADIDFMIATDQADDVVRHLKAAGYTNVSILDNVVFVQRPGENLRIDFLKVDLVTMVELMPESQECEVCGAKISVPSLQDLIAMKLFSLQNAGVMRKAKDLPDIIYLSILNDLDKETVLHPLCRKYASNEVYEEICQGIADALEGLQ